MKVGKHVHSFACKGTIIKLYGFHFWLTLFYLPDPKKKPLSPHQPYLEATKVKKKKAHKYLLFFCLYISKQTWWALKHLCVCLADTDSHFPQRIFIEPPPPHTSETLIFCFWLTDPASERKINENLRI